MTAGALGTGGGGGGRRDGNGSNPGAAGGSGIVIVRYELVQDTTAETLDNIEDSDADNKVYGFKTLTYTLTFSDDVLDTTVNAGDFDNAAASSPCAFTVGTIMETSPGVFTVAVTPTTFGNLQLRVKSDAAITDLAGNVVSNLPVTDNDTLVVSARPAPLATGGEWDFYEDGGKDWWSHIFTNSVNADLTTNINFDFSGTVEYLVVAGGGSGGSQHGGGGGGGGMVTGSLDVTAGTYPITVGKGGNAMGGGQAGTNGNDSVFATTIRAYGGGGGRGYNLAALGNGGSGGGGANGALTPNFSGGAATNTQGYAGGSATSANASGGGGGGAGSVGTNANAIGSGLGHGGIGKQSTFASGVATYYAGGGGGGGDNVPGGSGGLGGGGNGNLASPSRTAGTPGTGGGGGGDRYSTGGAAGGSGIVIIRYEAIPPAPGTLFLLR